MPNLEQQTEILKEKMQEGREFFAQYMVIFTLYLGVNAVLLKFSFDSGRSTELTKMLSVFGVLLSLVLMQTYFLVIAYRTQLKKDIEGLQEDVGLSRKMESTLLPIRDATIGFSSFSLCLLCAWAFIFFNPDFAKKIPGEKPPAAETDKIGG